MEHTKAKLAAEHQNLRGCIRKTLATLGEQVISSDNVTGDAVERIQTLVKLQMAVCESESALFEYDAVDTLNAEFVRAIEELRMTKYGDGYKPELGPLSFLREEVESYKVSAPQEDSDEVFVLQGGVNGITVEQEEPDKALDFGVGGKLLTVRPFLRSTSDDEHYKINGWLGAPWAAVVVDDTRCDSVFEFAKLCNTTPYTATVHLYNIWSGRIGQSKSSWDYRGRNCIFINSLS